MGQDSSLSSKISNSISGSKSVLGDNGSNLPDLLHISAELLKIGLPIYSLVHDKVIYMPKSIGSVVVDDNFTFGTNKVFPRFDVACTTFLGEIKTLDFISIVRFEREGVWYLIKSRRTVQIDEFNEISFVNSINHFMEQCEEVRLLYKIPLSVKNLRVPLFIDFDQRSDKDICAEKIEFKPSAF